MAAKINKDGLPGGELVSEKEHLRIMNKKRSAARKEAKRMSQEKVINPIKV